MDLKSEPFLASLYPLLWGYTAAEQQEIIAQIAQKISPYKVEEHRLVQLSNQKKGTSLYQLQFSTPEERDAWHNTLSLTLQTFIRKQDENGVTSVVMGGLGKENLKELGLLVTRQSYLPPPSQEALNFSYAKGIIAFEDGAGIKRTITLQQRMTFSFSTLYPEGTQQDIVPMQANNTHAYRIRTTYPNGTRQHETVWADGRKTVDVAPVSASQIRQVNDTLYIVSFEGKENRVHARKFMQAAGEKLRPSGLGKTLLSSMPWFNADTDNYEVKLTDVEYRILADKRPLCFLQNEPLVPDTFITVPKSLRFTTHSALQEKKAITITDHDIRCTAVYSNQKRSRKSFQGIHIDISLTFASKEDLTQFYTVNREVFNDIQEKQREEFHNTSQAVQQKNAVKITQGIQKDTGHYLCVIQGPEHALRSILGAIKAQDLPRTQKKEALSWVTKVSQHSLPAKASLHQRE